jgi:hypothetical protein
MGVEMRESGVERDDRHKYHTYRRGITAKLGDDAEVEVGRVQVKGRQHSQCITIGRIDRNGVVERAKEKIALCKHETGGVMTATKDGYQKRGV